MRYWIDARPAQARLTGAILVTILALAPAPASGSCQADFVGDGRLVLQSDRPIVSGQLCRTIDPDAQMLRCSRLPTSTRPLNIYRFERGSERAFVRLNEDRPDSASCGAVRRTWTTTFLTPEVLAAALTILGTNMLLLLAFWGRRKLDEGRSYRDWRASCRVYLQQDRGGRLSDIVPPEDERFIRAGRKAATLRARMLDIAQRRFEQRGAPLEGALIPKYAAELRDELAKMT